MEITIHFESSVPRLSVALHAWEPQGEVWDMTARASSPDGDTSFLFTVTGSVADQRTVRFKFRFPEERRWEPDDYLRRIPTRRVSSFWAFDCSPRVMIEDPHQGQAPDQVAVHLLAPDGWAGGKLYAWQPGTDHRITVPEAEREARADISTFRLAIAGWMRDGFHFKFMDRQGHFEDERSNRVWRRSDGAQVYVTTGQVSVRKQPLAMRTVTMTLVVPRDHAAPPVILRDDLSHEERRIEASAAPVPVSKDPRFVAALYSLPVLPQSPYTVSLAPPATEGAAITRPLRIAANDPEDKLHVLTVMGDGRWLTSLPDPVPLELVFHPARWTPAVPELAFDLAVGSGPAFDRITARRQPDGTWHAVTAVFPNLSLSATPISSASLDRRVDGPISSRRPFSVTGAGPALHTVDGQIGLTPNPPALPEPANPPVARGALMAAAFSEALVGGGIFAADEMPHGATRVDDQVYFVVVAPHAVRMALLFLDATDTRHSFPMQVTEDNRYWWCARPAADVPEGQRYRFLQNADTQAVEVLDPASRAVSDPSRNLWVNVGEGPDCAWSLYVDVSALRAPIAPGFSPTWEQLLIYELHPMRFTVRNPGVADGLDQVTAELARGRYLERLGVTALEFLPLHEFSKGSWGYNPSLFFAIDSTVGGPQALARGVAAAHAAGKAVMMDLVYNHVEESALQQLANDVYVDGETWWGAEINYDHPVVQEYFRQATVYHWQTFSIDGFRFDSTEAIVNGQWQKDGVIRQPGSGGGWDFLGNLRGALRKAADASHRPWPYLVGENDPNNWGMTDSRNGGVLDGQWHFGFHYPANDASTESNDDSSSILQNMAEPHIWLRPFSEAVRYAESHDSCGHRDAWKVRLVRRAPYGRGYQTAKAEGAVALLAHGVPMLFQGQEGGEDEDFFFDYDPAANRADLRYFARLALYEDLGDQRNRVLAWYRDLMGLRNDDANGLRGNDNELLGFGNRTVAFARAAGRFFVVATFGTPDTRQDLGWLGLPGGVAYKEIFNSSWPAYQVESEATFTNGSYDAVLTSSSVINLPPVGGVILERR